jgi:acid stress-induced BolA-like protein IbaG/YrbA
MHAHDIKKLIEIGLPLSTVNVEGDDGRHFSVVVISPAFEGKNRIQKQQLVHSTLGSHIADGTIHALSIKTFTPEEWHKHNQEPL